MPYAPGLADVFARSLALDGRGRLLDVGCGPGTVTLRLAPLFEAVVGVDPDAEMLAQASRAADRLGVANAAWVRSRAEDLPDGLGTFRAVTFAASFRWIGPAPGRLHCGDDARPGRRGGAGGRARLPGRGAGGGDPAGHAPVPAAAR